LGDRLAVGRQILDLAAQVRSLVPQPNFQYSAFLLVDTSQSRNN
jgi:hypothetical protein